MINMESVKYWVNKYPTFKYTLVKILSPLEHKCKIRIPEEQNDRYMDWNIKSITWVRGGEYELFIEPPRLEV